DPADGQVQGRAPTRPDRHANLRGCPARRQRRARAEGEAKDQLGDRGSPLPGSLMPLGDGTFCLGVLKSIQESAGVKRGDTITVELELDTAPRTVDPP